MRWQEEVTLTGYEMQWIVRYFQYMSGKWVLPQVNTLFSTGTGTQSSFGTGTGTGTPILSAGAVAYWNRKKSVWENVMKKADSSFKNCNPAYDSPL